LREDGEAAANASADVSQGEDEDDAHHNPELHVLPPHRALDLAGFDFERGARCLQALGLVDQPGNVLAAFNDLLHVLNHLHLHEVNLQVDRADLIGARVVRVKVHLLSQNAAEIVVHLISDRIAAA